MAQTVAKPRYQNLTFEDLIAQNFDRQNAYRRAISVFVVAFAGYERFSPELYQRKFVEYKNEMKSLYGININDENVNYVEEVKKEMQYMRMNTRFGIIKARGLHNPDGLPKANSFRVEVSVVSEVEVVPTGQGLIHLNTEEQNYMLGMQMRFDQFIECKRSNRVLSCKLHATDWIQVFPYSPINDFSINFREISAEGYEDWFHFGRGIEVLIKIEIQIEGCDPQYEYASVFHLYTIMSAIYYRMYAYNHEMAYSRLQLGMMGRLHKSSAAKRKISYIRKRVDPKSEMAFWSTGRSLEQIFQRIRTEIIETESNYRESEIPQILSKGVQYCDLQISQYFNHEYEEKVCVCSEWCNFNAFFHFNPIYRCLLVNHSQLYMKNRTKIPEMYLFCSTSILDIIRRSAPLPPLQPLKAPVLQLINQANEYRKKNYMRYFMRILAWRGRYIENSKPLAQSLVGMSHKILKSTRLIPSTIIGSDTNPFADICCDNISVYYKVLSDLHSFISLNSNFVDTNQIRNWFKELETISRREYTIYVMTGYVRKMYFFRRVYDFMFTEDYDYSNVFIEKSSPRSEVKKARDSVHMFAEPQNPLNIRLFLDSAVEAFVSVYKFFQRMEPILPTARCHRSLNDMFSLYKELDREMAQSYAIDGYNFHIERKPPGTVQQIQIIMRRYTALYTLKLYSMNFGLQKYFINSLLKRNKFSSGLHFQVSQQFVQIWKYENIENNLRGVYHEFLFYFQNNIRTIIDQFYGLFWAEAAHEVNFDMATYEDCIDSALYEYKRLYFWWRHNGDNRPIFERILEAFVENQEVLINRSHQINNNYILSAILSIEEYEYRTEVMDHLVYYLVRALCSMILNTIQAFLEPLHELQVEQLVNTNSSFTLSKPGWVWLFKTMNLTFVKLDQIQQFFIVFDDENERIVKTISQTRTLIKKIYRQFYMKLLIEWMKEINELYTDLSVYPNKTYLLPLHLASGLSFLCAFIEDFRTESRKNRKICRKLLKEKPIQIHQQIFRMCFVAFEVYVRDRNAHIRAKPFLENIWHQILGHYFQEFDQLTAAELVIDLDEAMVINN